LKYAAENLVPLVENNVSPLKDYVLAQKPEGV
jgi:hypothetical protein